MTGSLTPSTDEGTGIHVVGSLLPPASQSNLHPFGLLDYTVSYLGYLVFTSALGFEQVRTAGDTTLRLGRGDEFGVGDGGGGDGGSGGNRDGGSGFAASGTREDDGAVHRTGGSNKIDVTLTDTSAEGAVTVVGNFDPAWEVVERGSAASVDADAGTITFTGVKPGDTVTYIVEAPESAGQSTFGPAVAEHGDDEAEFGSNSDETVIPGENSVGGATGL